MKIIGKIALSIFVLLFACAAVFLARQYYRYHPISFLDNPKTLSGKKETIEVRYVNWACDCADFIETKYHDRDTSYRPLAAFS